MGGRDKPGLNQAVTQGAVDLFRATLESQGLRKHSPPPLGEGDPDANVEGAPARLRY
jgi:hypothetical protein